MNTNLGILLLCAPLAAAAERGGTDLEATLAGILKNLDRGDAEQVFRAIRLANPGGLGEVPRYDVRGPADRRTFGGDGGGSRTRCRRIPIRVEFP